MVARGADYRVRWAEQQLRSTLSLTDLAESTVSSDEDSFDSLMNDPQLSGRHSQGDDNSSEGDRSSEMAPELASGRVSAGAGGPTSTRRHAHARSTPALEEAAAAVGAHHRRRAHSLTDLRDAFLYRSASRISNAALGVPMCFFESTRLAYRHHRRRSRQRSTAAIWNNNSDIFFLEQQQQQQQHFRKKNSAHRFDLITSSRTSSRYSTQSCEWSVTALTIPEDVQSLMRAIEVSDQQVARACHEKMRLLDEYRELQLRYQSESTTASASTTSSARNSRPSSTAAPPADLNAGPTGVPLSLLSLVEARASATEKLVSSLRPLLANRQTEDDETGDGSIALKQSQVLEVMLALNSQISKLLV